MTIQEWFDKGCDYDSGVKIYEKLGKDKVLLRSFQFRQSVFNLRKLKYELSRLKEVNQQKVKQSVVHENPDVSKSPENKSISSKPISEYPVELHDIYKLRIQTFLKAATLKLELNKVNVDDWETALSIQEEIWELFRKNTKCWKILEHYDETGQILPTKSKNDFSKLSPQERVNERQRLYVNVSKRRKTIEKMVREYDEEKNDALRESLQNKILEKKKQLQHLQNDIDELSKLIKNE